MQVYFRNTAIFASVFLVGGCAAQSTICPRSANETASTEPYEVSLPNGCEIVARGSGMTELRCKDGRIGFISEIALSEVAVN